MKLPRQKSYDFRYEYTENTPIWKSFMALHGMGPHPFASWQIASDPDRQWYPFTACDWIALNPT